MTAESDSPVSKRQALRQRGSNAAARAKSSKVGTLWTRLNAVDFMNSAFIFGSLSVLCLFPFLAVLAAATGRDARKAIISRMGLNTQAAQDVDGLISSGHHAVATLTATGALFLLLGIIGIASTLQGWYLKVYGLPTPSGWVKQLGLRAAWVVGFVAYIFLEVTVGEHVGPLGGHVLIFALEILIAVLFWWWSVRILLTFQMSWHALFPTALATAICLTGLSIVSSLLFSGSIVSGEKNYGPVGVVMALLSFLIGFGVCLHIGAVAGCMWLERLNPEVPRDGVDQPPSASAAVPSEARDVSTPNWSEVAHRDWVVATLRATVSSVGLLLLYYLVPIEGRPHGAIVLRLSGALVIFAVIVGLEVRAIMKSRQPMLRAGVALATILPLFLIGFAWTYLTLARSSPATFGAPLTRTDALYFTVTVFYDGRIRRHHSEDTTRQGGRHDPDACGHRLDRDRHPFDRWRRHT